MPVNCPICHIQFARQYTLTRHMRRVHSGRDVLFDCRVCGLVYNNQADFLDHYEDHVQSFEFVIIENALNKKARTFAKRFRNEKDLARLLSSNRDELIELIQNEVNLGPVKVGLYVTTIMIKMDPANPQVETDFEQIPFRSRCFEVNRYNDFRIDLRHAMGDIMRHAEDFVRNGSNWVLREVLELRTEFASTQPLNGACGFSTVSKMGDIKRNLVDGDETKTECFYLAIAFHFVRKTDVAVLKRFVEENLVKIGDGETVDVTDIPKFLKKNERFSMRINVLYGEDNYERGWMIYPVFTSKNTAAHHINLILTKVEVRGEMYFHYAYVSDLKQLLRKRYDIGEGVISYEKAIFCPNCLHKFRTKQSLKAHEKLCFKNKTQEVTLPDEPIYFQKQFAKFKVPFIGFFDFESNIIDIPLEEQCSFCKEKKCGHKTRHQSCQEPSAYCYIIVDKNRNIMARKKYAGPDPVNHMINSLLTELHFRLKPKYQKNKKLKLSEEDRKLFDAATVCYFCGEPLFDENAQKYDKVPDHCHCSGEYLGALHSNCNLNRKDALKVPMFCHNFSGYDSHLILKV
mgnify:CR=1 FL=1